MPSPLAGDWGRIIINHAPNSSMRYCEFYYSSNGINIKGSKGAEITNCTFGIISPEAWAVHIEEGQSHYKFNDNILDGNYNYGLYANTAHNSEFHSNNLKINKIDLPSFII